MAQSLQALIGQFALDSHQVLLFDFRSLPDQALGHSPILRQHQQSGGIDVQPTCRSQPSKVSRFKANRSVILIPAILWLDQNNGRGMAILGLTGDISDWLVQQDGYLLALVLKRRWVDVDPGLGRNPDAERIDDLSIDPHPAVDDPFVRLATRAQAKLTHTLGQARMLMACRIRSNSRLL